MNNKHLGAVIVVLLIVGLVYGTLWMKDQLDTMKAEEQAAADAARQAATLLTQERNTLIALQETSRDLIEFLNSWEPYFESVNSPQAAELGVSMRIKDAALITLAQRYESVPTRGDPTIPRVMRVTLTIEDDYIKTINWLGSLEAEMPTLRIANLRLTKGQMANDIKLELVLEIPLATPSPSA